MGQVMVFAEPSNWATEFIDEASNDNLIPETLKSDYQNNIKRYEYVLLALRVLDQNNINVEIKDVDPFTDIANHTYKDEIIRAYNAGIVGGYEDNTFRPDNEIKREEVAALVYNLVKAINADTELPASRSTFSDTGKISNWALPFIEFNYVKSIISGTGKVDNLDTIDPLGKTTREQSITLLYKVSINKELLAKVEFDSIESDGKTWTSEDLNVTASNVGYDALKEAQVIDDRQDVNITDLSNTSFSLTYDDESRIEVSNVYGNIYLNITYMDINNEKVSNDFIELFSNLFEDDEFINEFPKIVEDLKTTGKASRPKLSSGADVEIDSDELNGNKIYYLLYKRKK